MFILSILSVLFSVSCMFAILMILIQRGKGNMGLGNVGGNNQMLFGSSGQDIFQKITWIFCAVLLIGSFTLSILRAKQAGYRPMSYQKPLSQEDLSFPGE